MNTYTILIKGSSSITLLQNAIITSRKNQLVVKSATVFWEYRNITKETRLLKEGGTSTRLLPGYYTIEQLKKELSRLGVDLEIYPFTGKCSLKNNEPNEIEFDLGHLLGFNDNVIRLQVGDNKFSENIVNINNNLRYINISCNLINSTHNIGVDGKASSVMLSLAMPTNQSLFGTTKKYADVESYLPVNRGSFNQLEFTVTDQDGKMIDVGELLLEFYIL